MIIEAIILGLCQIVTFVGLSCLFRMWADRKQAEIEQRIDAALHDWCDQLEEGKPSKLALAADAVGETVGAAAAKALMRSLKVDNSHVARVANGLSDEVQAEQNPLLGLLAGGARGKGAAVMKLAGLLGPMLAGRGSSGPDTGTNGHGGKPPRFSF